MGSNPRLDHNMLAEGSTSALVQMIVSLGSDVTPLALSPSLPHSDKTGRGCKRTHTLIQKVPSVVVCPHTHQGWVQAG